MHFVISKVKSFVTIVLLLHLNPYVKNWQGSQIWLSFLLWIKVSNDFQWKWSLCWAIKRILETRKHSKTLWLSYWSISQAENFLGDMDLFRMEPLQFKLYTSLVSNRWFHFKQLMWKKKSCWAWCPVALMFTLNIWHIMFLSTLQTHHF